MVYHSELYSKLSIHYLQWAYTIHSLSCSTFHSLNEGVCWLFTLHCCWQQFGSSSLGQFHINLYTRLTWHCKNQENVIIHFTALPIRVYTVQHTAVLLLSRTCTCILVELDIHGGALGYIIASCILNWAYIMCNKHIQFTAFWVTFIRSISHEAVY